MRMPFSRHGGSAVGQILRALQPAEQRPSGRHIFAAPTPYRYRLNNHHQPKVQRAAKVSAAFPSRNLQGGPLWKRRESRPLSQGLRNGHLKRFVFFRSGGEGSWLGHAPARAARNAKVARQGRGDETLCRPGTVGGVALLTIWPV